MTDRTRYQVAQDVARKASALAHGYFVGRDSLAVESKGAQNLVSEADRAVEALIRGELARSFPDDAFLGEETAASFVGSEERIWVVDPIDGTHNFLRGARYYCVSIAYVENGRREIGVIADPEHDEIFHARRGAGAWLTRGGADSKLRVSDCASLDSAFICFGHHDRYPEPRYMALRQAFMDNGIASRNMGAGALQLAHVAAGRYDGFIELSLNSWDALAGMLLVEEAGGYVAPFPGPGGMLVPAAVMGAAPAIGPALQNLAPWAWEATGAGL